MQTFPALMVTVTIGVTLMMVLRMYDDWIRFRSFACEGDLDSLLSLQRQAKEWVLRHSLTALAGLIVVALYQLFPGLKAPEYLAETIAVYVLFSSACAIVESLLAGKTSRLIVSLMLPVKVRNEDYLSE